MTNKLKPHLWLGYASVVIIKWNYFMLSYVFEFIFFGWGGGVGLGFFRGKQGTINRNI